MGRSGLFCPLHHTDTRDSSLSFVTKLLVNLLGRWRSLSGGCTQDCFDLQIETMYAHYYILNRVGTARVLGDCLTAVKLLDKYSGCTIYNTSVNRHKDGLATVKSGLRKRFRWHLYDLTIPSVILLVIIVNFFMYKLTYVSCMYPYIRLPLAHFRASECFCFDFSNLQRQRLVL